MIHPWYLDAGWQKKAAKYDITQGTPEWGYFVETTLASKRNEFKVPGVAGFTILALFGLVVLLATLYNGLLIITSKSSIFFNNRVSLAFRKHITRAPLINKRHSTVYRVADNFLTVQAPLQGEVLLLLALLIANFIPLVAFYSPYTTHNVSWPNDTFYQIGRYLTDRSAILAVSQLPILILLSGRNNPVSFLTGASFATCMLFHRWIARIITVQVLIHAIGYSIIKTELGGSAGYRKLFDNTYVVWGLAACIALVFLCFFSLRWFRQKSYEWFVITHIILAITVMIGIFYHIKLLHKDVLYADFINFIYASIAFWCFDKFVRLARVLYLNGFWSTGCSKGLVRLLDGTDDVLSISLTLTGKGAKCWYKDTSRLTSGLNIQLWIPRVHPLSSHPFSVAAIEENGDAVRLQLYVQVKKGITARLLRKAQQKGGECELSMMVEGFYGQQIQSSPVHTKVCIAGGIGITGSICYLQDAMRLKTEAHLIWLISSPKMIAVAVDALRKVEDLNKLEQEGKESPCRQSLSIYITRPAEKAVSLEKRESTETLAAVDEPEVDEKTFGKQESTDHFLHQLQKLHPLLEVSINSLGCRPDLNKVVLPFIRPKQTTLFCCGPAALLDSARDISRQHDIDYGEEAFAW